MIRTDQVRSRAGSRKSMEEMIAGFLAVPVKEIKYYEILHHSIDARRKPDLFHVYSFAVALKNPYLEKQAVKRKKAVFYIREKKYGIPQKGGGNLEHSPVVVGTGPAGLFAAYLLAQEGLKPLVLERGDDVEERTRKVEEFWDTGVLDPESNVSFGEGGAGTFSDGKLNTGVKDKEGRNHYVLETFVKFGAGKDILYENNPHIGTDVLRSVVKELRQEIIRLGGRVMFRSVFRDFTIQDGRLKDITIYRRDTGRTEVMPCDCLVLAIGHSARDTYLLLKEKNLPLEQKAFAVGFRMEHSQDFVNLCQYGEGYDKITPPLPASPYKVTYKSLNGRGVYSFCMCPGGYIVNASSSDGELVVNGMSYSGRNGVHANSAILVSVNPSDYGSDDPLAGMYFQKKLEASACREGKGKIPVQLLQDYLVCLKNRYGIALSDNRNCIENFEIENKKELNKDFSHNEINDIRKGLKPVETGSVPPSIKGGYTFADLSGILPKELQESFVEGIFHFDRIMPGFAAGDALLAGVESRTSSPVKVRRSEDYVCEDFGGIYPCGEGCGYAGGIMSAAMDGMKAAEAIIRKYGQIAENNVE